ncbi:MAG: hypothetical protein AB1715_08590 [Acidobacteriota bacterium]
MGNQVVVENDSLHRPKEDTGAVILAAVFHPLRIEYFNNLFYGSK